MDLTTYLDKWDNPLPISSTKARRRREEMVRHCANVPGWEGKIKMIVTAEHHVCRFLWELHHHGKIPENRFNWLVDQVLFRFAEARVQPGVTMAMLAEILGPMPPMRVDYKVEKPSGVWDKYEGIMLERTAREKEKQQQQKSESPSASAATAAPQK
ncbi:hypothetical protein PG994_005492 [Apiospora phragmitis]|uniref:Uncharacterized protein n=1 Tax=Apiospora phragmitis TaxID=2905665 RepID=A0ABR1VCE2_9PEZI